MPKPFLCKDCGETEPDKFYGHNKSKCKACQSSSPKNYKSHETKSIINENGKKVKIKYCKDCGETNPEQFKPTQKSRCILCQNEYNRKKYIPIPQHLKKPSLRKSGAERKIKPYLCKDCGETNPDKFKYGKKCRCWECLKIQKYNSPKLNLSRKIKIRIFNRNTIIRRLLNKTFGKKILQDSVLLKNNGVLIKKYNTITLAAIDNDIGIATVRKYAINKKIMPDGNYFEIGEKSYQHTTIDTRIKIGSQEYFIQKLIANHGDVYLTDRVKYSSQYEEVELGCKKHLNYFKVNGGTMLRRTERNGGQKKNPVVGSCPICIEEYFADIKNSMMAKFNAAHSNEYTYGEYVNQDTSMKVYCKIHGEFEVMPYYHSIGRNKCPICYPNNMSIGEHRIRDYFERKELKYVTQKTFEGCKNINLLRFDFYVPVYNLIVEFDGYQHYGDVPMFEASLADVQKHDAIKNKYCEDNDINLLRIPYWELDDNTVEWTLDNEITRVAAEIAIRELQ